jgi:hypothetical protein
LVKGASQTIFASYATGSSTPTGVDIVNTVTVQGTGASSGVKTCPPGSPNGVPTPGSTCSAQATIKVLPISVSCTVTLVADHDMDNKPDDNNLFLPAGEIPGSFIGGFHVRIDNTGKANLLVNLTETLPATVQLSNCQVVDDNGVPSLSSHRSQRFRLT